MFENVRDSRQPPQRGGAYSRWRAEEESARAKIERDRYLMGQALGVFNHPLLTVLQFAGFTAETIVLLEFVPLAQIAWADGTVSNQQRDLILQVAMRELVGEETPAHNRLIDWLERCPSHDAFWASLFAIHAKLDPLAPEIRATLQRRLVRDCTAVALVADSAMGDHKIAIDEARVLARIFASLKPGSWNVDVSPCRHS